MAFEYPSSSHPLYNRTHETCGFCRAIVLAELLLTFDLWEACREP